MQQTLDVLLVSILTLDNDLLGNIGTSKAFHGDNLLFELLVIFKEANII